MIDDWPQHLARTLVSGMATATLEQQLDALLIWLGNPDNPNVALLDAAIARTGLTRLDAAGRAYDILDRLLFAGPSGSPEQILGLRDTHDITAAKQRYRCLIQAYHPDRHPARALVHNERTEQINIAYAAFERGVREPASRAAPASDPVSTRKAARPRRRRAPKQADPYPLGAARSRLSLGGRLRRWLGGAESFQTRFFVGLILLCVLLLASLLYPEPAPYRAPARLDVPAVAASDPRLDGVERPEVSSDVGELQLDAPKAPIASIPPPTPAPPSVTAPADIRTVSIASPTPDARMPLPAPSASPAPEPVAIGVAEPVRAPAPVTLPERKAAVLVPPEQTPPRLHAVAPPSLLDRSGFESTSRPDASALPTRVVPIRPVPAPEQAHALAPGQFPDPSPRRSDSEIEAAMRAHSATSVIPPVATAKTTLDPLGPDAPPTARRADPPASPTAPARAKASAEAPVQPLPKRPPAVDETATGTAGKTPGGVDQVPGATSEPRRSSPGAPGLSPAPDPSKTTQSAKALDCEPIAGALDRLRRAYNAGALDSLMALYRPDAQENETRGQSGIRQLYVDWFDQTSDRRIAFSGVRIRPEGKGRCAVRAGFRVSYRDAQGHRVDRTGSTVILFDGRGADARILRVSY